MIHPAFAPTLLALAPALADPAAVALAQLTIRERVVVRVRKIAPVAAAKPIEWRERKGPKCVSPGDMAGVLINREGTLDMVLYGGQWLRAKLGGQCRTLDFYSGIYLKAGSDGQICAGRDSVRARSGAGCRISTFRKLEAKR